MTASPNPYEAPRAAAEQHVPAAIDVPLGSRADVRRGATLVVAFDAGRAIVWRTVMGASMAYPSESPALFGSRGFSIGIKLLGAAGVLAGTLLLTRPSRSGLLMRAARWARVSAGLAVVGHGVRLALQSFGADVAVALLEPATTMIDAAAIAGCAWCVGSFFSAARLEEPASRARLLGGVYVAAAAAGAWVSAVAIPGFPRDLLAPSAVRPILSILFVVLALLAMSVIRRLGDVGNAR